MPLIPIIIPQFASQVALDAPQSSSGKEAPRRYGRGSVGLGTPWLSALVISTVLGLWGWWGMWDPPCCTGSLCNTAALEGEQGIGGSPCRFEREGGFIFRGPQRA